MVIGNEEDSFRLGNCWSCRSEARETFSTRVGFILSALARLSISVLQWSDNEKYVPLSSLVGT